MSFYSCVLAFVVLDLVFSIKPRDWLGRTSPKLFILGLVGRIALTQSISATAFSFLLQNCLLLLQ